MSQDDNGSQQSDAPRPPKQPRVVKFISKTRLKPKKTAIARALISVFSVAWVRVVYRCFVILLVAVPLEKSDFIGSQTALDNVAHDAVMHLSYGVWGLPEDPGRDPDATEQKIKRFIGEHPSGGYGFDAQRTLPGVTVILWTDDAMDWVIEEGLSRQVWPIDYEAHSELLHLVAEENPRSIYLDFVFPTKRDDESFFVLQEDLETWSDRGVPLLMSFDPLTSSDPVFPEMEAAINRGLAAQRSGSGTLGPYRDDTPAISFAPATLPNTPVLRTYCLDIVFAPRAAAGESDSQSCIFNRQPRVPLTAASSGYDTSTVLQAVAPKLLQLSGVDLLNDTEVQRPDMFLHWDRRSHLVSQKAFDDSLNPALEMSDSTIGHALSWLYGVVFDLQSLQRPLSGPLMIPADWVFAGSGPDDILTLEDVIKDRIVLIGSAQEAAADFRNSPNAPGQPGVLGHAVAVENLLRFEDTYIKDPPTRLGVTLSEAILLGALILSSLAYALTIELVMTSKGAEQLHEERETPVRKRLRYAVLSAGTIFAAAAVVLTLLHLPPGAWVHTLIAFCLFTIPFWLSLCNFGMITLMYKRKNRDAIIGWTR